MGIFSWLGKLFLGQAKDAASQVITDEINKVHDEISVAVEAKLAPLLGSLSDGDKQAVLEHATELAKQAAVAYAEAYVNAHLPVIPATSETPGQ